MNASKETGVPDFTSIASFRVWGCSTIPPQYVDSEVGLLLEITGTGLGPRWAQTIKGTGCSNSVPAHSWPLLSQQKKKYIYIWNLRNFQNCCLEDGSRYVKFWDAKCLVVSSHLIWRACLCLRLHVQSISVWKDRPHYSYPHVPADNMTTGSTWAARCPLTCTVSGIITDLQHQILFKLVLVCVCVSILLCELKVLHQASRWHKFQANPSNTKALMKRKSPPPPTSTHPSFWLAPSFPSVAHTGGLY